MLKAIFFDLDGTLAGAEKRRGPLKPSACLSPLSLLIFHSLFRRFLIRPLSQREDMYRCHCVFIS